MWLQMVFKIKWEKYGVQLKKLGIADKLVNMVMNEDVALKACILALATTLPLVILYLLSFHPAAKLFNDNLLVDISRFPNSALMMISSSAIHTMRTQRTITQRKYRGVWIDALCFHFSFLSQLVHFWVTAFQDLTCHARARIQRWMCCERKRCNTWWRPCLQ